MSPSSSNRTWAALVFGLATTLSLLTGCLPPPRSKKAEVSPPPPPASPAAPSTLSPAEAAGKTLFDSKCLACHTVGKGDTIGPDLAGVVQRREKPWLVQWLKDPETMLKTDKVAMEMLKTFKNVPMPNQNLSDAEIESIFTYLTTAKAEAAQ